MDKLDDLQEQVDEKIKELENLGEEQKKDKKIEKMVTESEKDIELDEIIASAEELAEEVKEQEKEDDGDKLDPKEPPKKHNILIYIALMTSIFLPPIGIILSIIALIGAKKKGDKDKLPIFSLIIGIVMTLVFVAIGYLGYQGYKETHSSNKADKTTAKVTSSSSTTTEVKPSKSGTVYYYQQMGDYVIVATELYKNYNLLSTYTCNTDECAVYAVRFDSDFGLIFDNGNYFIFDYARANIGKSLKLDSKIKYTSASVLSDASGIYGIELFSSNKRYEASDFSYYDYNKDTITFNLEATGDYQSYGLYTKENPSITNKFIVMQQEKLIVYNYQTKAKLFEIGDESSPAGAIKINDKTYYATGIDYVGFKSFDKLFDENFNVVINSKMESYEEQPDGSFVTTDGNYVYKFVNNEQVSKSEYYEKVYDVYKDYYLVKIKEEAYLYSYDLNTKVKIFDINKSIHVHTMLSGWYTDNGKNGIYIVVGDSTSKCEDLSEDMLRRFYGDDESTRDELIGYCNKNKEDGIGYEYYYIPSNGEVGKIPTIIGGYAKPVLYLYPTKNNTPITVSFAHPELLTTTYPKYIKNWNVVANTNGDLKDSTGRYYYGLYWEESKYMNIDYKEGFYVTKDNAIGFLEEKLSILGFSQREANEFIMYWLPILEKNEKSLVYFETTGEREAWNSLNISPRPDSLLRVAIHVKKVNKKTNIKEQSLPTFNRTGFSAIEWGGISE